MRAPADAVFYRGGVADKIILAGGRIMSEKIPYKIYLEEKEIPRQWYNVRADMKNKPAPLLNPETKQPMSVEELSPVPC